MSKYHLPKFQFSNAIRMQIKSDNPNYVNMLKVYGMIAFQFDIHPMLMTIEVDMQNKAKIGSAVCYALACKVDNKITKKTRKLMISFFLMFQLHAPCLS